MRRTEAGKTIGATLAAAGVSSEVVREHDSGVRELPAKVLCPKAEGAFPRARLFAALDQLTTKPITWLHAPAGSGKTTLLATYLRARQVPVLWYDVDAGDAEADGLYHYLGLGARGASSRALELPTPRPASPAAQAVFARRFFEALFAQLPNGTCLVFDNYQQADHEPAWTQLFRELCATVTPRVRVLVGSRVAPPAALARFGASDDLQLLTGHDLRLDEREIGRVLAPDGGPAIHPHPEASRLLALTGGWAVAVALIAKSRGAVFDKATVAWGGEGDELQSVFDYLAGEILDRLDGESRELLLKLAVLPHFTKPMAVALTQTDDAGLLLARWLRHELLVERHGNSGFRFHDLFRVFLLDRAARTWDAPTQKALAVRAARLLADSDQFPAAADLLMTSKSWPELAELIEQRAPALASQGRLATLTNSLECMPAEHRQSRPWLLYWHAVSLLGYRRSGAYELAESAFAAFRARGEAMGSLLSCVAAIQAIVIGGDDLHPLEHWFEALEELSQVPTPPEVASKVALGQLTGMAFWETGSAHSVEVADRAMETLRRHGSNEDRAMGTMGVWFYVLAGLTERVRAVQDMARELATEAPDPLAKIVFLHSEAAVALTRGRVHAASRAAEQGLALATESGIDAWNYHLIAAAAMGAIGRRDFVAAERWIGAMTVGPSMSSDFARGYQGYVRGWLAFEQGDLSAAIYWNDDSLRLAERIGFRPGWYLSLAAAVIHRAASGDESVGTAIDQLDEWLRLTPSPFMKTQGEIAKVYAQLCRGRTPKDSLREAFRQARRLGYGAFLAPRVVFQLASAALEYGIECDYAVELLRAHDLGPVPEVYGIAAWPWPVRIRVLGGLHIELEGQPVKFGRKAPTALLMLLQVLAASDAPIATERLSAALWAGAAASAPRGSLDTALYRLRKLLGTEAAVRSESGNVTLDPNVCWTDTRAFALCCARISELAGKSDKALELAGVDHQEQKLLDLYRGPILEDAAPRLLQQQKAQYARRFARAAAELDGSWKRLGDEGRRARLREAVMQRSGGEPVRVARLNR